MENENSNSGYFSVPVTRMKLEGNNTSDISTDLENNNMSDIKTCKIPIRRTIDIEKNRYPFCLVWTPLPIISWILPFIGHTGICTYIIN
jgi:hypothetical protein